MLADSQLAIGWRTLPPPPPWENLPPSSHLPTKTFGRFDHRSRPGPVQRVRDGWVWGPSGKEWVLGGRRGS